MVKDNGKGSFVRSLYRYKSCVSLFSRKGVSLISPVTLLPRRVGVGFDV